MQLPIVAGALPIPTKNTQAFNLPPISYFYLVCARMCMCVVSVIFILVSVCTCMCAGQRLTWASFFHGSPSLFFETWSLSELEANMARLADQWASESPVSTSHTQASITIPSLCMGSGALVLMLQWGAFCCLSHHPGYFLFLMLIQQVE